MLHALDIRDMLIIDRLALEFAPGLNVLTGETGAGKSILLDCLNFVLGGRGRADLLRQGADSGQVTAAFDVPDNPDLRALLAQQGIDADDELILRRVNAADGRKTAFINGQRVPAETLRLLAPFLLEIHGQHDDRGILNPKAHRAILDAFAGTDPERDLCRAAWQQLRKARTALDAAEAAVAAQKAEEDYLRHSSAEINDLAPQPGEEQTLDTRRRQMQAAEKTAQSISAAQQAMGYDGAEGAIVTAIRWLEDAAPHLDGAMDEALETLSRAQNELASAGQLVDRVVDSIAFDPHELESCEERLFALRALARKHQCQVDDLPALGAEFDQKLALVDGADAQIADLSRALTSAQANYDAAAQVLSAARRAAAAELDAAMPAELAPLKMERAVFETRLTPADPGPEGVDEVSFVVATNPGTPAGPLGKIASGGELSRFLLALKLCLRAPLGGPTMIFDEIDRGVGGATADAVGKRLARLAEGGQVLVVTHAPQVAAKAQQHMLVSKLVEGDQTFSRVTILPQADRVDEIARMLSGDQLTDAARAAAQALMDMP